MVKKTVELPVFNRQGQEVDKCQVELDVFATRVNRQLLHDVVVMYEANQRVGTVRTRSRAEVAGSGKKMYRQKGTGNARAGSRRSNIRRGGGMAFAKRPKDWTYRLPKKAVRRATRMAILSKIVDDEITVLDELSFSGPKTSEMVALLGALGLSDKKVLLATAGHDPVVWKSARNLENACTMRASDLNAYAILKQKQLVLTRETLDLLKLGNWQGSDTVEQGEA
mgnify:CR=1 FL=1|jgi:large subunit ribosomal protein L4|tara:strand:+ start:525 stop:1196 length:672 start_codon:yes stop_codon:yes gene_type:complete